MVPEWLPQLSSAAEMGYQRQEGFSFASYRLLNDAFDESNVAKLPDRPA
jgi:hypothetical protein